MSTQKEIELLAQVKDAENYVSHLKIELVKWEEKYSQTLLAYETERYNRKLIERKDVLHSLKEASFDSNDEQVYLHFHCEVEGCSNVFVKCREFVADIFLDNYEFLKDFVEIWTLNGGDPEFSLKQVKVQKCYNVIPNQHCKFYCDLCLVKNTLKADSQLYSQRFPKEKFDCGWNDTWNKIEHLHFKYGEEILITYGDLSYYHETTLFESVMLYCFLDLMRKIFDKSNQETKWNLFSKEITRIQVAGENGILGEIKILSGVKCEVRNQRYNSLWIEPINLKDTSLLNAIDQLISILVTIQDENLDNLDIKFI